MGKKNFPPTLDIPEKQKKVSFFVLKYETAGLGNIILDKGFAIFSGDKILYS